LLNERKMYFGGRGKGEVEMGKLGPGTAKNTKGGSGNGEDFDELDG